MLITTEVEIKLTNRNISTYKNLGYIFKSGDIIKIKTEHLSKRSDVRVDVLCDYCLDDGVKTVVNKKYADYIASREFVDKDSCKKHSHKKLNEVKIKLHGESAGVEQVRETFTVPWNDVVDSFRERGYILISDETDYKNTNTKLKYICPLHKDSGELEISYSKLKMGRGCKYCGVESVRLKKRISYSCLNQKFEDNGFELKLTEDDYNANTFINHTTSLPYICRKHPDKGIMFTSHNNIARTRGCSWCASDLKSGEGHYGWRGGVTEIHLFLRNTLTNWKKDSMEQCSFRSVLSRRNFDVIHHVYGFDLIMKEVFENTKIPIKSTISQYSKEELEILENECLRVHNKYPLGVCITNEEHKMFHKIYGTGGNTIEQWEEFKIRYNNNEFEEIA